MSNNKHLTLSDRSTIESLLNSNHNFKQIALSLDKDPSTISKEVRSRMSIERIGGFRIKYNACANRSSCLKSKLCQPCNAGKNYRYCKFCGMCNRFCPDFVLFECQKLKHPPYVCNGCSSGPGCTLEKHLYRADVAHDSYTVRLSESRTGISLSEDEIMHIDSIVSPLIRKGQSPHHICVHNFDSIMISERSLYRLIDMGLISAKNIDLPRKVRYKSRKKKKTLKVDRKCRIGRTFDLFLKFMEEHPDLPVVQIDSVEGKKGGKVLLTIHFVKAELMLAFIRDFNDSKSVSDIFDNIFDILGLELFKTIFPVILTDNGSEFSNPSAIEFDHSGVRRTNLFYCDPQASWQKGSAERNHEFIRCFIPKGSSMDAFSQDDISLMMDHINSYCRESLNNKSPFEMFSFLYGSETLELLGCHFIRPSDVTLNRSVFKNGGDSNAL